MLLTEIATTIAYVWDSWIQDNPRLTDPLVVNNGYCFDFALSVWEVIPNVGFILNPIKGQEHVVVVHNNRFFDAECLSGVTDIADLPIWQRIADLQNLSVEEVLQNCKSVNLRELCQVFDIKYPPTKE